MAYGERLTVAGGTITSVSGTANRITASTFGGAVTIDISGSYVGQTSLTTVGALTTGSLATGFTPVTVPIGGTGLNSVAAYSVVCGGITTTDPLQTVASLGTAGQVLTSNGAGALPSFENAGGGSLTWSDKGSDFNAAIDNGYFCMGPLTATLPAIAASGSIIKIVAANYESITITPDAADRFQFGLTNCVTLKSTDKGNTLNLVSSITENVWYVDSSVGNWTPSYSTFDPTSIGGCVLWIDGNDPLGTGTSPADGSKLLDWIDKSGYNNHYSQNDPAVQPTFNAAVLNDLGGVTFGGINFMEGDLNLFPTADGARTIFVVFNTNVSSPSTNQMFMQYGNEALDEAFGVGLDSANALVIDLYGNTCNASTFLDTNFYISYFNYPGSGAVISDSSVRLNTADQTLIPQPAVPNTGSSTSYLGMGLGGTGGMDGRILEIIMYNFSLGTVDRDTVYNYLATKWGI